MRSHYARYLKYTTGIPQVYHRYKGTTGRQVAHPVQQHIQVNAQRRAAGVPGATTLPGTPPPGVILVLAQRRKVSRAGLAGFDVISPTYSLIYSLTSAPCRFGASHSYPSCCACWRASPLFLCGAVTLTECHAALAADLLPV